MNIYSYLQLSVGITSITDFGKRENNVKKFRFFYLIALDNNRWKLVFDLFKRKK